MQICGFSVCIFVSLHVRCSDEARVSCAWMSVRRNSVILSCMQQFSTQTPHSTGRSGSEEEETVL